MKKLFLVSILFFSLASLHAQEENKNMFTGNLSIDSKTAFNSFNSQSAVEYSFAPSKRKSPLLAGLMSLVIPGAGEFYAESYWKAGLFLAIEAAAIIVGLTYDKKGDDQTNTFQNYADKNWSVVRYAEWLIQYEGADPNIITSNDESLPPWKRVNWKLLNENEHGSHKLPPHGDQQYYELIGKYFQYAGGWNDYTGGANNLNVSPNYLFYSGMRGKANDYYSIAAKAVIAMYINHFLSALDAVWSVTMYNSDLAMNIRMETNMYADYVVYYPALNFKYSF